MQPDQAALWNSKQVSKMQRDLVGRMRAKHRKEMWFRSENTLLLRQESQKYMEENTETILVESKHS